jgi:trigger factor
MKLAERRVRLGLVLAEIGEKAGVQVSDDETAAGPVRFRPALPARPAAEQVYEHVRQQPERPRRRCARRLFEEKVVDHLLGVVSVTDKKVTRDELMADDEDEATTKASDDKKANKKKAPAKKKAAKKDENEGTADA